MSEAKARNMRTSNVKTSAELWRDSPGARPTPQTVEQPQHQTAQAPEAGGAFAGDQADAAQLLVGDGLMLDFVVEFLQIADAVDNDPVEHQRNYLAARSFPVAPKRITFTAAICRRS